MIPHNKIHLFAKCRAPSVESNYLALLQYFVAFTLVTVDSRNIGKGMGPSGSPASLAQSQLVPDMRFTRFQKGRELLWKIVPYFNARTFLRKPR